MGEVWQSPHDKCVLQQCVKVRDEVFISATNVSCSTVDTPSCQLGWELRCDTQNCCPRCQCGKHTHTIRRKTRTFSLVLSYAHCLYAKLQLQCLSSRWLFHTGVILVPVVLTWPYQAWCMIHCLMNVSKIICAFLPAAPLDACVLNNTLIGVSHAEKQSSYFILENLNNASRTLSGVCLYRQGRGWWWMCAHTVSVRWSRVPW